MVWMLILKCLFQCYASWRLRRARKKLDRIKLNNYRQSIGLPPVYTFTQRIWHSITKPFRPCCIFLKKRFFPCCLSESDRSPPNSRTFAEKIWTNGTLQNHLAKCFAGFISGVLLTIFVWQSAHSDPIKILDPSEDANFLLKVLENHREPRLGSKIFIISGGLCLTIALTFSEATRCILVLALSQFFTNKGRAAILAYAFILAYSGPYQNTITNMEILTESLACGQELLKSSIKELFEFVKEPFSAFQKGIGYVIDSLGHVFGRLREELEGVVKAVRRIIGTIKDIYESLKSTVDYCEHEFGTPFERCMAAFKEAEDDCKEKMEVMEWMCGTVDVFSRVCHVTKVSDAIICWFPSLMKEYIWDPIVEQVKKFAEGFKTFFDARLNITYKLDHSLKRDKTLKQVFHGMRDEIVGKCEWIFDVIGWIDLSLAIPILVIGGKALSYRWRFLHSKQFDNYYLSSSLIQIDVRRVAAGADSLFPLRNRENNLYVETFSWRMVKVERKQRKLAIAFVCIGATQIFWYVVIDYLLYKFMEWIRLNSAVEYKKWHDPSLGLQATIEGEGFLAEMYRSILHGFSPLHLVLPTLDTTQCLPIANRPNFHTYFWIGFLVVLCFLLALFEPYGLRVRHLICGWIYPQRVIERERWLYVHMLTTRGSFLTFARNKIRDKIGFGRRGIFRNTKGRRKQFRVSCGERLVHKVPIMKLFFDPTRIKCFVCGLKGEKDDRESFLDCMECDTVYCKECMGDMHDQCVICSKAMDSDASSIEYGYLTEEEIVEEEKTRLEVRRRRKKKKLRESESRHSLLSD